MSLVGATTTITVTLTPDFQDVDGYPAVATYQFDVIFMTSCTTSSVGFSSETSD